MAAKFFHVPIATITLVDADRQRYKASYGFDGLPESPRDLAFCANTIFGREPFVVEDTWCDVRFANNPFVTGPPYVRFYAGAPLTTDEGSNIGDIGLINTVPRTQGEDEKASLAQLARVAMAAANTHREIVRREQATRALRLVETKYKRIVAHSLGMVHQFVRRRDGEQRFSSPAIRAGNCLNWNRRLSSSARKLTWN